VGIFCFSGYNVSMDPELNKRIDILEGKVDAIYQSVEKTRKYFLIITWVTILAIVLPMIGLFFAVPAFMTSYVGEISGLGL
jgi:hypothetical protein